jgi:hypothetical protein
MISLPKIINNSKNFVKEEYKINSTKKLPFKFSAKLKSMQDTNNSKNKIKNIILIKEKTQKKLCKHTKIKINKKENKRIKNI